MRENMLEHSEHHLDWRLRRAFYLELGQETAWARAFRGWLAVLCVQKVLPILLKVHPAERQIFDELSASIAYLQGQASPHDLRRLLDDSYHGHWYGLLDFCGHPPPENALAVRMASFKGMLEVKNWDEDYGWLEPLWELTVLDEHNQPKETTDEDWIHLAMIGDAASAAAVAFACTETSPSCYPDKLRAFWTWWLDDGWSMAERLAHTYPSPTTPPELP